MKKEYWIGIVVAALVVVGVVVGVSLAGGGGDDAPSSIADADAAAVQAQLQGVPQSTNTIGDPDAPVEIVEYGDLACPACQQASTTTVPEAIDQIVKPGDAKMTFRPIAFISRSSERGALGAEAAGMQDAMWSFVELIYRNQGSESDQDWLTDDLMAEAAGKLGLDVDEWKAAYAGKQVEENFLANQSAAQSDKVTQTPTFVVKGPRGQRAIVGAVNVSDLQNLINEVGPAT